jgi:hypothetical protein
VRRLTFDAGSTHAVAAGATTAGRQRRARRRASANIMSSLVKALRAGHRSGQLRSPHPLSDAITVRALVAVVVDLSGRRRSRRAAREHVTHFTWPALALPLPHPQYQLPGDSMLKDLR